MSNLNMITPLTVQGIINKFCYTIGMLPTSYKQSLTYEEQLLAIGNYLETTVYPAINHNAEALAEVQRLFKDLHDYVENFFDNLDVSQEISDKLDEMAEDGTLENIINQEIFGEINDAIDTINNTTIPAIETDINNNENNIELLNTTSLKKLSDRPTIFVGDSYLNATNNYGDYYKQLVGLNDPNYYRFASNGAGFYATGSGGLTFLQVLQNGTPSVTNPNDIKQIIVGSGLNDGQYGATIAQMQTAITNFLNYCKTTFPNATVYLCAFGFNSNQDDVGGDKRFNLAKYVYYAYSQYYAFDNYCFIKSSPYWLKDSTYFDTTDYLHPTQAGQQRISRRLASCLIGDNTIHEEFTINTYLFPDGNGENATAINISGDRINDNVLFNTFSVNVNTNPPSISAGIIKTEIGTWSCNKVFPTKWDLILHGMCYIINNGSNYSIPAQFILDTNGKVYLRTFSQAFTSITRIGFVGDMQIQSSYYC